MLKSKSTPIFSKNSSLRVMKRTSMVTCRSCMRRNCSSRSTISSWTSCVWLMTRLRLVSNLAIDPGPPTSSQVVGWTVEWIKSMMLSKSACGASARSAGAAGAGRRSPGSARCPRGAGLPANCASTCGLIAPLPDLLSRLEATTASGVVIVPPALLPLTFPMALCKAPPAPCSGRRRSSVSASPGRPRGRPPCRPGRPSSARW